MKKLLLLSAIGSALFFSCSDQTTTDSVDVNEPIAELTRAELDDKISEKLLEGQYNWDDGDVELLWNAVRHGEKVVSIGYGAAGESFAVSDAHKRELDSKKESVISLVEQSEGYSRGEKTLHEYEVINVIDMQVEKLETLEKLLANPNVRYVNPVGYGFEKDEGNSFDYQLSSSSGGGSGCSSGGQYISSSYYNTIAPGAQASWNYAEHNIQQAWGQATGSGVTIGLVDTGIAQYQYLLNSGGFNDGYSSGRTVEKYGTFIDSNWWWSNNYDGPHDKCGHGTAMASTMGAPRNNNNMPVGVAYNSNIVSYRAAENVVLNDYHERKGVTDAIIALANRGDVKIISMSMGYPWGIGNIRDAVRYAYSRNKLFFAAAGTSLSWTSGYGVIFPADMSETVAVTGVNDLSNYGKCDTCHEGSEVEFTIRIQDAGNTDAGPVVLGRNNGERRYTGGSSAATASTAGIAAMVWEKHPNWSRNQVLQKLRESSDFYPTKDGDLGYGNIDALAAVQ